MYKVEVLSKLHKREGFDCGVKGLNDYIKGFARKDIQRDISITYVIATEEEPKEVIGYYALSQYFIQLKDVNVEYQKKLPRYPNIPATLLGRLAVDRKYHGRGMGQMLLYNALKRSLRISKQVASNMVVVDALGEGAVKFYERHGFLKTSSSQYKLYLPMKFIEKEFGR